MDRSAFKIPKERLVPELDRRIERKKEDVARRDSMCGQGRIPITSYMENIGWPELFGYEMERLFDDPEFNIEQCLRQAIFWADNVDDDSIPSCERMAPDVGMYWDATLFGQRISHTSIGVPEFIPHPFQSRFDLALLGDFDFLRSGDMPRLIEKFSRMKEISTKSYGGRIGMEFPRFHRGPLDLYIQLRGYDNFLEDLLERPEGLREGLNLFADARLHFASERAAFLGEAPPDATFVADDWVNVPFISPDIFRDFVVPVYRRINNGEAAVTGFHTCGNMEALLKDLLEVFPGMKTLDVSGWNDFEALDRLACDGLSFKASIVNTVSLAGSEEEQRRKLEAICRVSRHRKVDSICAQAIVRLHPTYEETLARLNRFIALARRS